MQVTTTDSGCDWYAQLLKVLRRSLMQAPVDFILFIYYVYKTSRQTRDVTMM